MEDLAHTNHQATHRAVVLMLDLLVATVSVVVMLVMLVSVVDSAHMNHQATHLAVVLMLDLLVVTVLVLVVQAMNHTAAVHQLAIKQLIPTF